MFSVLIAGLPVPEYHQDGKVYVESNLWTPVSYNQRVREMVYGEVRLVSRSQTLARARAREGQAKRDRGDLMIKLNLRIILKHTHSR